MSRLGRDERQRHEAKAIYMSLGSRLELWLGWAERPRLKSKAQVEARVDAWVEARAKARKG